MKTYVVIKKEKTDPLCMRVSIGGTREAGYYLVFRGDDMDDIEKMIKKVLVAFKKWNKET